MPLKKQKNYNNKDIISTCKVINGILDENNLSNHPDEHYILFIIKLNRSNIIVNNNKSYKFLKSFFANFGGVIKKNHYTHNLL